MQYALSGKDMWVNSPAGGGGRKGISPVPLVPCASVSATLSCVSIVSTQLLLLSAILKHEHPGENQCEIKTLACYVVLIPPVTSLTCLTVTHITVSCITAKQSTCADGGGVCRLCKQNKQRLPEVEFIQRLWAFCRPFQCDCLLPFLSLVAGFLFLTSL